MLLKKDLEDANLIADSASMRELVVIAAPGSPVGLLNDTLVDVGNVNTDNSNNDALRISSVADAGDGKSRHSTVMDELVETTLPRISAAITYAKNVIAPFILSTVKIADEQTRIYNSAESVLRKIVPIEIPAVYTSAMLIELTSNKVNRVTDAKPIDKALAETLLADVSVEDFKSILKSDAMATKAISAVLDKMDDQSIRNIMHPSFLYEEIKINIKYNTLTEPTAILAFLFLSAVRNSAIDGVEFTSFTSDERLAVLNAINYFGYVYNKILAQVDTMLERKVLIIPSDNYYPGSDIYVLRDLYDSYLESTDNPGSNEAILGFMALNDGKGSNSPSDLGKLWTNSDYYKAYFDKVLRTHRAAARQDSNAAITRIVAREINHFIRDNYDDPAQRAHYLEELMEQIEARPYTSFNTVDQYVSSILLHAIDDREYSTSMILHGMRTHMEDDNTMSADTAALLSVSDLVTSWVCSQITVC